MSVYAIYFSPTKTCETIVKLIGKEFKNYQTVDLSSHKIDLNYTFSEDDICIVGVPSYGGRVPSIALQRMNSFIGNNAKVILVTTYGNRTYKDTLHELQAFLAQKSFCTIAAIAVVAQHSILNQFASGRPNEADKNQIVAFIKQLINKQPSWQGNTLKLPGNYPYCEYTGIPLKPTTKKQCTKCGVCVSLCPVMAISLTPLSTTNNALCISCMRCVTICPSKARHVSQIKLKVASIALNKSCSTPKNNEFFM